MLKGMLCAALIVSGSALAQVEALENPGTVVAVQDRQYRMNHELTLGLGVLPLDAFYKGVIAQVAYTYHFTDHFAWQVGRGAYSYNLDTGLKDQLQRQFAVQPTAFDEVNWMVGSDLIWTPFYGKLAYLNRAVQHFEVFLVAGASVFRVTLGTASTGLPNATTAFRPAANLGIGVRLFASKFVSWRIDITDEVVFSDRIFNVPTVTLSAALNFGSSE